MKEKCDIFMRNSVGNFVDSFMNIFTSKTINFLQTIMNPIRYVRSPDSVEVLQFYLRIDPNYDEYDRTVYTIMNLSSDIGGLSQTLFGIGLALTFIFSDKLFKGGIMSEIYQEEDFRKNDVTEGNSVDDVCAKEILG